MKRIILLATLFSANAAMGQQREGNLVLRDVPAVDAELQAKLQPYLEARPGAVFDWMPQGDGIVIGARFGDAQQIHLVRTEMGARKQITFAKEPISFAISNRNYKKPTILYALDIGGNEQFQLHAYDILKQQSYALTTDVTLRHTSAVFAPDGLHYVYNRVDGVGDYQVCINSIETQVQPRCTAKSKQVYNPQAVASDLQRVLVQHYRSISQSTLLELDLKTGKSFALSKAKDASMYQARYSADGQFAYFLGDEGKLFQRVFKVAAKKNSKPAPITPDMDVELEEFALSPDDKTLAMIVNNNQGSSEIWTADISSGQGKLLGQVSAPPSVMSSIHFHPRDPKLLLQFASAQVLNDAYVLDIPTQKMARYTEHEAGGLRTDNFSMPDRIQFASGKGKALYNIQAYVYRPSKLPESKKAPVVVLIHGGPEAQARPGFDGFVQFLVNEMGIAVVVPNIRGSTGYGRLFTSMDDGVQRIDALNDLKTLLDEIAKDPNLDGERVALMGGSYGGFMTLWGLTEFSDRLRAGVDIVGISDLSTFLTNTANYRRDLRRAEYGDERDPKVKAFFDATSPLKNASKIKVPLFVIQGANDPRVPASEAAQIAAAARGNDVQVWEMTALDEGHGFKKKQNSTRMRLSIAQFLRATLLAP